MYYSSTIVAIIVLSCGVKAQDNLLINGGFESYSELPNYEAQINRAVGWSNLNGFYPNSESPCPFPVVCATPDFFHLSGFMPYTWGFWNNCLPVEGSGFAFFGLGGFNWASSYEYISSTIESEIIVGLRYHLRFSISYGIPVDSTKCHFASNNIGVLLSTIEPIQFGGEQVAWIPQFNIQEIVTHNEYREYSYEFTADSACKYITFGNFFSRAETDTVRVVDCDNFNIFSNSYRAPGYFIDDIYMLALDTISSASEVAELSQGVRQDSEQLIITLTSHSQNASLILHDLTGKQLLSTTQPQASRSITLNIAHLPAGIYTLIVESTNGISRSKIVISR